MALLTCRLAQGEGMDPASSWQALSIRQGTEWATTHLKKLKQTMSSPRIGKYRYPAVVHTMVWSRRWVLQETQTAEELTKTPCGVGLESDTTQNCAKRAAQTKTDQDIQDRPSKALQGWE